MITTYTCPHCQTCLDDNEDDDREYTCPKCGFRFELLDKGEGV